MYKPTILSRVLLSIPVPVCYTRSSHPIPCRAVIASASPTSTSRSIPPTNHGTGPFILFCLERWPEDPTPVAPHFTTPQTSSMPKYTSIKPTLKKGVAWDDCMQKLPLLTKSSSKDTLVFYGSGSRDPNPKR
ncbi:hypothetical protein VTL71DRAFT_3209 [Oculimacula yallundae]|uniref:Uncharacterized protein n=1 Tax=Oculimacula yallundae TaxID=86028 RepID=A0ABR4C8D6_9HELO